MAGECVVWFGHPWVCLKHRGLTSGLEGEGGDWCEQAEGEGQEYIYLLLALWTHI